MEENFSDVRVQQEEPIEPPKKSKKVWWVVGIAAIAVVILILMYRPPCNDPVGMPCLSGTIGEKIIYYFESTFQDTDTDTEKEVYTRGGRIVMVPHPSGGMYLGQTEIGENAVNTFESTILRKVGIYFDLTVMSGVEELGEQPLEFDVQKAQKLWGNGYLVPVSAWEATPARGQFRVDNLLRGDYDEDLHKLAEQFKEFGKPMIFSTGREPNGALNSHMGGFGPLGDKAFEWAVDNEKGFAEFDASQFSIAGNPGLLNGLGDDQVCDGMERFAAAQRYYYDYFVRREGINFLTFDSMGWSAGNSNIYIVAEPGSHEYNLRKACFDPVQFFESMGSDYYDWASVNLYFGLEADEGERHPQEPPHSLEYEMELAKILMDRVRSVAPEKPVLVTELGFCRPDQVNAVKNALPLVMSYPEIKAGLLWGDDPGFPCLVSSPNNGGSEFKQIVDASPSDFHSCIHFSDGSTTPNCDVPATIKTQLPPAESSCMNECLTTGESENECTLACSEGGENEGGEEIGEDEGSESSEGGENPEANSCFVACMYTGETEEECTQACSSG